MMSDSSTFSLYLHIPFCSRKCAYCSFLVLAYGDRQLQDHMQELYTRQLISEIRQSALTYGHRALYTIYIGGGTPTLLGPDRLCQIIDTIRDCYQTDHLAELSIECNPDMSEQVLETVAQVQSRYSDRPRIRRSIGIQTRDDQILEESHRGYRSQTLIDFFDRLRSIRQPQTSYNMDLIAFGKLDQGLPWTAHARSYRHQQLQSGLRDHCSLYTLELFEGSQRYHQLTQGTSADQLKAKLGHGLKKYGDDDAVYEEFGYLCTSVADAGYYRYELSNFAKAGQESLHNKVYRHYGDYLGLGLGSSSKVGLHRRSNTKALAQYLKGAYQDDSTLTDLSLQQSLQEQFFLGLRTEKGIYPLSHCMEILESDWQDRVQQYMQNGYLVYADDRLRLTSCGMDIYNHIITDLIRSLS